MSCRPFCDLMDCKPTKLLCPWDFPDKNTWVGYHFLLQGIFLTQGLDPGPLHFRQILYCLSHQGSQKVPKNPTFEQQQCWWSSWLWLWVLFFFLLYVKDPILALMHLVQVFAIVEVWRSTFPLSMGLSRCLSRRWPLKDACSSSWARR